MEETVINPRLYRYMEEHGIDRQGNKINGTDNNNHEKKQKVHEELDEEALIRKNARKPSSEWQGKDFLDVSLEHHFEYPNEYKWDVAVYEVLDLIGGSSAVGNLAMRTLGFLALNPEMQELIKEEADYARKKLKEKKEQDICDEEDDGMINLHHRTFMPFTECTLMETLRLASSPIIPHVAERDSTVQGFHVEKGTMILFNTYILNTSEKYWKEPEKFDPKRFLVKKGEDVSDEVDLTEEDQNTNFNEENETQEYEGLKVGQSRIRKPEFFIPFSLGRRACLGYKMVMSCSFVSVANLCDKYVLSLEPGMDEEVMRQLKPNGNVALPLDYGQQGMKCFGIKLTPRK